MRHRFLFRAKHNYLPVHEAVIRASSNADKLGKNQPRNVPVQFKITADWSIKSCLITLFLFKIVFIDAIPIEKSYLFTLFLCKIILVHAIPM